jgi:Domain of unknown function (DUF4326)
MPERIRLQRSKGWRKPANTVTVARPTRWGNPFTILEHGGEYTRDEAVARYREALLNGRLPFGPEEVKQQLRGKNVACWCPLDKACHGDVLLDVANA